ncbi:TPA: hypothetical protein SCV17_000863 [Campylobacter coli]|uniref:hypothetical protein n=1 Tax=Campylobacter coli TaxID=195 RepID=UPI0020264E58|nr:hypothetical protein [Campylobacter coli]HEG2628278.1 hypothetical protein [Campylobacter coli]
MSVRKILISGFISDNFLDTSGFFEEMGFKKPKIEENISCMLNAIVSTEDSKHLISHLKIQKMYHCLLQDFDKEASKKRCYIANKDLLYIAEDWLKLDENILFVLFYEDPVEFLIQRIPADHKFCFGDILDDWLEYNSLVLEFYGKNKDKCILVNGKDYDVLLSRHLNEKYGICLERMHKEENSNGCKNRKIFDLLLGYLIDDNYQNVKNVYENLEKLSINPVCKKNIFSKNIEQEVVDLFYLIEANSLLKEKNESLLDFIFDMQEDIERLYHDNQALIQNKTIIDSLNTEMREIKNQHNQALIQNKTIIDSLNTEMREIKNQLNETQSQISLLSFYGKYGTAKARIQDQLSYKLGQAMIVNSKSISGCLLMPITLLSITIAHKQSKKIYQEKIKKDPSLKLPPIERYPDYHEALKLKKHLSYRLGNFMVKNPLKCLIFPYFILKIIYQFKGERYA